LRPVINVVIVFEPEIADDGKTEMKQKRVTSSLLKRIETKVSRVRPI